MVERSCYTRRRRLLIAASLCFCGTANVLVLQRTRTSKNVVPHLSFGERSVTVSLVAEHNNPSESSSEFAPLDSNQQQLQIPSYRQLIVFTATTILIWLSEPLLSLVDTTVVGLTATQNAVTQLASLGPATTLYDSCLYTCYFLSIATTNLVARHLAQCDWKQLQETVRNVLGVAVTLGAGMTAFLALGRPVLRQMMGRTHNTLLLDYATHYTWIRSLSTLPSIVGMVLQSICLASLDTTTPARAVLVASCINIVGDLWLCPRLGVAGAAWATTTAACASTIILFQSVVAKMKNWKQQQEQEESSMDKLLDSKTDSNLSDDSPMTTLFALPNRQALTELIQISGPIFFVILAKVVCYGAMTLRCTHFGVVPLAAHNVMMRIFFFYGCFGDALSQTAQSFLPATANNKWALFRRMLVLAAAIAVTNCQTLVQILQHLGQFITTDTAIIQLMQQHTTYFGWAVLLHPFIMLLEGMVIASRDFQTLITTYVLTLGLHFGILKFLSNSFAAVWRTFFVFQSIRLGLFSFQVWRRRQKPATNDLQ